jgi:uncharacterized protein YdaU (DUF1376 family)
MNYYRRHIGDYMKDASHLSLLEHGVYSRLLDVYYTREQPIPGKDAARLIGARSKDERAALVTVLAEFFVETSAGWRQKRCDEEITRANAQAATNRQIAEDREARKRARIVERKEHESLHDKSTNRSPESTGERAEVVNLAITPLAITPLANSQDELINPGGALRPPPAPPPSAAAEKPATTARKSPERPEPKSAAVWEAYAGRYRERYGTDPVRNAKVNGQLAALVDRLGVEEAPPVAGFYVGHNRRVYVEAKHAADLLLRDCEGLRTEWATGRHVTSAEASQVDRTQTNANAFAPLLEEARLRRVCNES